MIFRKNSRCIQSGVTNYPVLNRPAWFGVLALTAVVSLFGCDKQTRPETKVERWLPLVKVNDIEIATSQPVDEMALAEGRPTATKEAIKKQVLETLIDRQLLRDEALRNELDHDPEVMQAIDNAKTKILAESYLQSKFVTLDTPSSAKVDAYFRAHPELFTQRKLFYMTELVVATKDFSERLQARLDSAKSIEQVATWLDKNHVQYKRSKLSRSTADLAPEMIERLQKMRKNQLFVIKAGEYSMLSSLNDVKPSPVTAAAAAPQIEQYLSNKKRQEIGDAELGRLRASANIEYLSTKQLASANSPAKVTDSAAPLQMESGTPGLK